MQIACDSDGLLHMNAGRNQDWRRDWRKVTSDVPARMLCVNSHASMGVLVGDEVGIHHIYVWIDGARHPLHDVVKDDRSDTL